MSVSAPMKPLGDANGVKWYWAEPGQFEKPGVYYWDGKTNVLCVPFGQPTPIRPETTPQDPVREALRNLIRAYVNLLELGRDRIIDLGGQCDAVDVMERNDFHLKSARAALALPVQSAEPVARVPGTDPKLLESFAKRAGMVSLLDMGAASCVHSEGCNGVTQEHLTRFCEIVAGYCVESMAPMLADAARTERNRDMWKGQCERQAEELSRLRAAPSPSPASAGERIPLTAHEIERMWINRDCIEAIQRGDIVAQLRAFTADVESHHGISTPPSTKGGEHEAA